MKKCKTEREFVLYQFKDSSGEDCSMQKSSNIEKNQVWIGMGIEEIRRHPAIIGQYLGLGMLIDQKMAWKLALKLAVFAETGEI